MFTVQSFEYMGLGAFLGLSAGISPGPLTTLVITQTIRHNRAEGLKIALSPLITDLPIILATLLIFSRISQFNTLLGVISFVGGIFVAYLGYESFTTKGIMIENPDLQAKSLKKGVLTNFLSPNPYLFWATIGTPYIFRAYAINTYAVIIFFASFYLLLIGSKMSIAYVVAHTKEYMGQKTYLLIMKLLGLALFVFSILFFYDGIKYLRTGI